MRKNLVKLCLLTALTSGVVMQNGIDAQAANKYDKMVIANVDNSLNVRKDASTSSKVVGQMKRGAVGTIVKKGSKWTKIKSGKVTGYVSNDYILTGKQMEKFAKENIKTKDATVTTEVLNVRAKKSTSSKVIGKVTKGTTFSVKGQTVAWTKINYKKQTGYLSNDYIEVEYRFITATPFNSSDPDVSISDNENSTVGDKNPSSNSDTNNSGSNTDNSDTNNSTNNNTNSNTNNNSGTGSQEKEEEVTVPNIDTDELREEIVDYALQFVGNPYVYGGTSLTEGADCSGFVQSVFGKFGIKINRVSADQATNGREISLDEIQPGDLIFYVSRGSSRISHVSLYIGNDMVVHALNQAKGICVTNMYYNTPYMVRNIID